MKGWRVDMKMDRLLKVGGVELYLINGEGETTMLLKKGDLEVVIVKQVGSNLATIVALVGDLHWPMGRGCPCISLGDGRYTFVLPGSILYGLHLPGSTPPQHFLTFHNILRTYSTFQTYPSGTREQDGEWQEQEREEDIVGINKRQEQEREEDIEANKKCVWQSVAWKIETTSSSSSSSSSSNSKVARASSGPSELATSMSPPPSRVMKQIEKARRMSAVTKLISRTLQLGVINATLHVDPPGPHMTGISIARVDAFATLVEAIESQAWRGNPLLTPLSSSSLLPCKKSESESENEEEKEWTLNNLGLGMLLRAISTSSSTNSCPSSSSNETRPPFSLPPRPPKEK